MPLRDDITHLLDRARTRGGPVVALTGAGISSESGIPTFRGAEGYWTVGSRVYHPQEMATHAAFVEMPDEVWRWYAHRRRVCRAAPPNAAHRALARLEAALGDGFTLITQNVDGLHLRAGNTLPRTHQIHGNIDFYRCSLDCCSDQHPLLEDADEVAIAALSCPACGARVRPHVLWFDECYDEPRFRATSALRAASRAALLLIIGTSASTNLPWQVVATAAERGAVVIDINIADNPFADIARRLPHGAALASTATGAIPDIVAHLLR